MRVATMGVLQARASIITIPKGSGQAMGLTRHVASVSGSSLTRPPTSPTSSMPSPTAAHIALLGSIVIQCYLWEARVDEGHRARRLGQTQWVPLELWMLTELPLLGRPDAGLPSDPPPGHRSGADSAHAAPLAALAAASGGRRAP